jgi:hypothetical protein
MLSPVPYVVRFRDVSTPALVRETCVQSIHPLSRANTTLLHNPQGLLQLLPFLNN